MSLTCGQDLSLTEFTGIDGSGTKLRTRRIFSSDTTIMPRTYVWTDDEDGSELYDYALLDVQILINSFEYTSIEVCTCDWVLYRWTSGTSRLVVDAKACWAPLL